MGSFIIKDKEYIFDEVEFFNGMQIIDREKSRDNLLELKKILDFKRIEFGLIYGTLLGAVRENNFIAHDQDTDIFMLQEAKALFIDSLFYLREHGFELARNDKNLMTIIRDGEYIDIYFFKRSLLFYRKNDRQYVIKEHLEKIEKINFFNEEFRVPYNHILFLEKHYGYDWRIPMQNKPAKSTYFIGKYKEFIKKLIFRN